MELWANLVTYLVCKLNFLIRCFVVRHLDRLLIESSLATMQLVTPFSTVSTLEFAVFSSVTSHVLNKSKTLEIEPLWDQW